MTFDDLKLARAVADRRADLFDQGGTCRLDGDPGQDRSGGVFHNSRNGGLRKNGRGQRGENQDRCSQPGQSRQYSHIGSLFALCAARIMAPSGRVCQTLASVRHL